ncbi:hypothetical protein [Kordiimonas aquimaris]|uniref:hypothetical protein n=1 Tax=Kordiimonas aquimaris TaxID=707591 RepID=UPI0021CF918A|nr:hypothetical protein [Kordiimonas aquimaris]
MSHVISIKRAAKVAGVSLMAIGMGACSQVLKHSNTLIFATNTTSGLKIGADEKQLPGIQVGHSRQEVAFVPVLANTGPASGGGDLAPCDAANAKACKFVGTHDGKSKDSYSTLASFGSKKGASVDASGNLQGTVAIAQYFATGVAAQQLAISGGANVVSAGGDTKAKADAAIAASKDKAAIERTKLRTQALSEYASGKDVALVMMGNDPSVSVDPALRAALASTMGAGCTDSILSGYPQDTVKNFLDGLDKNRKPCFDALIPNK